MASPARLPRSKAVTRATRPDAYSAVRGLILGGAVRPGQRLSHRSLAKDLGLSRSPVREALLQLEAEGLIEHRPQSGVYLRELSEAELRQLYEIRELIEPYAAERAARHAGSAAIDRLRRTCAEFTKIAGRDDLVAWLADPEHRRRLSLLDRDFHATILAASGNRIAERFFTNAQILSLVVSWNFLTADSAVLAARVGPTAEQHAAIFRAIQKGDARAAGRLMRSHVTGVAKLVLDGDADPS
mgnify:CR=1 FL=1